MVRGVHGVLLLTKAQGRGPPYCWADGKKRTPHVPNLLPILGRVESATSLQSSSLRTSCERDAVGGGRLEPRRFPPRVVHFAAGVLSSTKHHQAEAKPVLMPSRCPVAERADRFQLPAWNPSVRVGPRLCEVAFCLSRTDGGRERQKGSRERWWFFPSNY